MQKLSLGTAQFGMNYGVANKIGKISDSELKNILSLASNNNINFFDTAMAYGNAEKRLGEYKLGKNCKLVSKVGEIPKEVDNISKWLLSEVKRSLDRLKLDKLEALLLHRPQQLFSAEGKQLYVSLLELKDLGLTNKIGVSVYFPNEIEQIQQKSMKMDLIQIPLNIIDSRFTNSDCIQRLYQQGTEIHARSIFLQGLLLMPQNKIPTKFNHWHEVWDNWRQFLEKNQVTALDACLNYALSIKEISKVIIGIDSVQQLQEIIEVAKKEIKIDVPTSLKITDEILLNPSNWVNL